MHMLWLPEQIDAFAPVRKVLAAVKNDIRVVRRLQWDLKAQLIKLLFATPDVYFKSTQTRPKNIPLTH